MGQFWTFLSYLQSLAGPCVMLLYPLYASIQAIESPAKLDDEQWLAYWVLYSFLTLVEMVAAPVLKWIPIWYHMKVLFVSWLVLPQFRGASFMYQRFVREQLKKADGSIGKDRVLKKKMVFAPTTTGNASCYCLGVWALMIQGFDKMRVEQPTCSSSGDNFTLEEKKH